MLLSFGYGQIVEHLADLESPWNCPHGRPTMRHLVDLTTLLTLPDDDNDDDDATISLAWTKKVLTYLDVRILRINIEEHSVITNNRKFNLFALVYMIFVVTTGKSIIYGHDFKKFGLKKKDMLVRRNQST